jgi:hypothetical protein
MLTQAVALREKLAKVEAARLNAQRKLAATVRGSPALRKASALAQQGAMQIDTAMRGAANVMTLGIADHVAAGANAAFQAANGADLVESFHSNLRDERTRGRLDAAQRPVARGVGNAGGAVMGVAATAAVAPAVGVATAAPRLAGAAALTGREIAAIIGGGGVAGLGVQVGTDTLQGRTSTVGDSVGAAIGGAVGAASLPAGPVRAGAIGAAATTTAQDYLNGRTPSSEHAAQAAVLGAVFSGFADGGAQRWSNGLPTVEKGRVGGFLGNIRGKVRGEPRPIVGFWPRTGERNINPKERVPMAQTRDYIPGTNIYWYPDGVSANLVRFEDKFGFGAELSRNQIIARDALGDKFVLFHTTPTDVGKAAATVASQAAVPLASEPQDREKRDILSSLLAGGW